MLIEHEYVQEGWVNMDYQKEPRLLYSGHSVDTSLDIQDVL